MSEFFDVRKKLHLIPPILQDYAFEVQNSNNTPEVRENYAQRFEAIRDYSNWLLELHKSGGKGKYRKTL